MIASVILLKSIIVIPIWNDEQVGLSKLAVDEFNPSNQRRQGTVAGRHWCGFGYIYAEGKKNQPW